jgi:hypothetical protein
MFCHLHVSTLLIRHVVKFLVIVLLSVNCYVTVEPSYNNNSDNSDLFQPCTRLPLNPMPNNSSPYIINFLCGSYVAASAVPSFCSAFVRLPRQLDTDAAGRWWQQ